MKGNSLFTKMKDYEKVNDLMDRRLEVAKAYFKVPS